MPDRRYRSWDDYATDAETSERIELEPAAQEDEDAAASATADPIEDWSDAGALDDWPTSSSAPPNEDYE